MNIENMKKLRNAVAQDLLAEQGLGLNMGTVFGKTNGFKDVSGHDCKTVGCLAGWTAILCGVVKLEEPDRLPFRPKGLSPEEFNTVHEWLGVQAPTLFHPPAWSNAAYASCVYTKPVILAALDIAVEEGKVTYNLWNSARNRVEQEKTNANTGK